MQEERFYSEEEAQEILRLATHEEARGGLTRDVLARSAAELGISPGALERAEAEVMRNRGARLERQEFRNLQRRRLFSHLVSYVLVNLFLVAINVTTSPSHFWFLYPMIGWGLGLAFHVNAALNERSTEWQEEFDQWRKQRSESTRGSLI